MTLQIGITIVLGLFTVGSFLMALARTPPEDAKSSWQKWLLLIAPYKQAIGLLASVVLAITSFAVGGIYESRDMDRRVATQASILMQQLQNERAENERKTADSERTRISFITDIAALNNEILRLKNLPETMTASPSPALGLTDVSRWQITNTLRVALRNQLGEYRCNMRVFGKPSSSSSEAVWRELHQLVEAAGFHVEGGRHNKASFPNGISIGVAQGTGKAFTCAFRFSEMFESLKLPYTLRSDAMSPDLGECEDCFEVVLGDIERK